ncbi:discoidin domain-containing protein [Kiritimatiellaeota bacterium B1221]|nr:discoidin domain-containing protein [Kiritimatiellaeota bacterium B1221]
MSLILKRMFLLLLFFQSLLSFSAESEPLSGLTLSWVTEGEFATDAESISTGGENAKVLVDGNTGSNWKSRTYSKWSGGSWVSVVADLGGTFAVDTFDVWALHEATRDTGSFEVLTSMDGKDFRSLGKADSADQPKAAKKIIKMTLKTDAPVNARFVKFRIQRAAGAKQQQVAEIAVWGTPGEGGEAAPSVQPEPKQAAVSPAAVSAAAGEMKPLSNLKLSWVTEGEFATDSESVSTGGENAKVLVDGNTGDNWKSRTYSKWGGGRWVTVVADLGTPHILGAFDVWALHESTRDTGSFEVLVSDDGSEFRSLGTADSKDQPKASKKIIQMTLQPDAPVQAQFVKFRMQRRDGAKQQQIAEIGIRGSRIEGAVPAAPPAAKKPAAKKSVPAAMVAAGELSLLSNNIKPGKFNGDFPAGTSVQPTDLKFSWVKEGEYATDAESISTGGPDGKVLFDGNTGSNWKSRTYSKWSGGQWVTVVADLGSAFALQAFDVWALHEASRDTGAFYVLLSDDGENFTPHGMVESGDQKLKKNFIARMTLKLDEPVKARYVKFRIQRRNGARQQQVAEIAIWGALPEEGVQYLGADSRPKVKFKVETIQSGVAKIDWSENRAVHSGVTQWKIYAGPAGFEDVKESEPELLKTVPGNKSHAIVYPLDPGQEMVFGVTAVYPQGEYALVEPVTVRIPEPLQCDTFGDMVAVNHFWEGGGHRNSRGPDQRSYDLVALDLLGKSGIKQTRWWVVDPKIYQMFYEKGVGVYTYPHGNNIPVATQLGVHSFSGPGNEPDLKAAPVISYVNNLKKTYAKIKKINPDAVVCAPSSGLEDTSIAWLDEFYELGGKDHFDVLDLHTYCKIAGGHVVPEGYPKGAPEAMYDNMRKINEVLERHGDTEKPLISTEFGYSDALVNNPSGRITPRIKAEFLVRGLVIHHALGFDRVFLYSFWDEGEDMNFSEHRFGLLDYNLQKKEAYYAVETALNEIGNCALKGPVTGLASPSYGYVYGKADDAGQVAVIWDGASAKDGIFKTSSASVKVVDMFGNTDELLPDASGTFSVTFGSSPVYLHTDAPISVVQVSPARAVASAGPVVPMLVQKQVLVAENDEEAALPVELNNPNDREVSLSLVIVDAEEKTLSEMSFTVPALQTVVAEMPLPRRKNSTLERLKLNVVEPQPSGIGSRVTTTSFYLRSLQAAPEAAQTKEVKFPLIENPMYLLSNADLAVTIDAWRGGRLLELIDRKSASNQIRIDYGVLPNIQNVPFAFGIWDSFNGKLKNDPMEIVEAEGGRLVLSGKAGELEVRQTWTLKGASLTLAMDVKNPTGAAKKFSYKSHPEYTVGGVGESVTDVLGFPRENTFETIPFWSGLGKKKSGELYGGWWAAVDTVTGLALKQKISGQGWAEPGIWFGQGHYNVELATERGFEIPAGESWEATLTWTLSHTSDKEIQQVLESLR